MKISVAQYTQSLFESVFDKNEKEVKAALKNFVALLGRNMDLAKAPAIEDAFQALWEKEKGEVRAQLISARELGPTARETVLDYLKKKTSAQKITLTEEIDKKLLGGFVLKYNSKVLDGSLKTSLEELKVEMGG
ncbi:MAG: ATP synthase F1 subunit delta [Patescibacteria group bacterium]